MAFRRMGWQSRFGFWRVAMAAVMLLGAGAAFGWTRAELSPSALLDVETPVAAPLPFSLACTAKSCAAFTLDSAAGCRMRGTLLDAQGAPREDTRVDFGRTGCRFMVTAAGDDYVLAHNGASGPFAWKLLLLDGEDLSVVRELESETLGYNTLAMSSDGATLLALDWTTDDIATTVNLATGKVIAAEAILDYWKPVVVPGAGQYLFFYPNHGYYLRLNGTTGHWMESAQEVSSIVGAYEATGHFRDGIFQLAWRYDSLNTGISSAEVYGSRVDAGTGKVLDLDASLEPTPQLLCKNCPGFIEGAFQLGAWTYVRFAPREGAQSLLALDPVEGKRLDPSLTGPDVTFPESPVVGQLQPTVEPRLATSGDSVHRFDSEHLSQPLSGSGYLPGKNSGMTPSTIRLASNGESYLAIWYAGDTPRAARVVPQAAPALAIESVQALDLGISEQGNLKVASAGGKFLVLGVQKSAERRVSLVWRVIDGAGQLGETVVVPTSHVLTAKDAAGVLLASDGERYLLALFVGPLTDGTGVIEVQRLDADGAPLDALTPLVSGAKLLHGVHASFAEPSTTRQFGIAYSDGKPPLLQQKLRLLPAESGLDGETLLLDGLVVANDGSRLLLSSGKLLSWSDGTLTPLDAPEELRYGVRHWDGHAYVKLASSSPDLIASAFSGADLSVTEPLTLTHEQVGNAASVGDGKGRSLIAYFATEPPEHVIELRAALFATTVSEGGAGGEGGEGGQAQGGHAQGGQATGGASGEGGGGSSAVSGDAGVPSVGGAPAGEGGDEASPSKGRRLSSSCGCQLPGDDGTARSALLMALLLGAALSRRRKN